MIATQDTSLVSFTAADAANLADYAFIESSQSLNSAFALGLRVILSDPLFFITAISTMVFLTLIFALFNYFRRGV